MNIKSPSTTALLKLATPLQISPDGVVITFKNDRLVAQMADANKKQMIVDAANVMFNQDNTSVTVRLAQSNDVVVQPTSIPQETPRQVEVKPQTEKVDIGAKETVQTIKKDINQDNAKDEKDIKRLESDQEKMVLDLFDGKYVE